MSRIFGCAVLYWLAYKTFYLLWNTCNCVLITAVTMKSKYNVCFPEKFNHRGLGGEVIQTVGEPVRGWQSRYAPWMRLRCMGRNVSCRRRNNQFYPETATTNDVPQDSRCGSLRNCSGRASPVLQTSRWRSAKAFPIPKRAQMCPHADKNGTISDRRGMMHSSYRSVGDRWPSLHGACVRPDFRQGGALPPPELGGFVVSPHPSRRSLHGRRAAQRRPHPRQSCQDEP